LGLVWHQVANSLGKVSHDVFLIGFSIPLCFSGQFFPSHAAVWKQVSRHFPLLLLAQGVPLDMGIQSLHANLTDADTPPVFNLCMQTELIQSLHPNCSVQLSSIF
jgi:hypothetical protein